MNPYKAEFDRDLTKALRTPRLVYVAGPFFKPEHILELKKVEDWLKRTDMSFYSPRLELRYKPGVSEPIVAQRAFWLNKFHIKSCRLVLACLSFPDAGTAWELGYADAFMKPRLGWTTNARMGINLMISQTVNALVNLDSLEIALGSIAVDIKRGRFTVMRISDFQPKEGFWQGQME